MAAQGERVVDLIEPMDMLVNSPYLLRGDVKQKVPPTGVVLRSSFLLPNGSSYGDQASTTTTTTSTSAALESVQSSPVLGDFQMELAFPQDVLGSTVYASQMVSREKGINFDAVGFEPDAELPACLISSKQLQEAVSNILDNAIKYVRRRRRGPGRPRIPQVKVSITANEPPLGAGCTIWVEDNGPGIPEGERESVFERGFRSSEVRDEVKGSGLGLSVAKFWLNQMGGRIELLEKGGPSKLQGTTVRIILFRDPER
jgi:signal transduction histidine kinase